MVNMAESVSVSARVGELGILLILILILILTLLLTSELQHNLPYFELSQSAWHTYILAGGNFDQRPILSERIWSVSVGTHILDLLFAIRVLRYPASTLPELRRRPVEVATQYTTSHPSTPCVVS